MCPWNFHSRPVSIDRSYGISVLMEFSPLFLPTLLCRENRDQIRDQFVNLELSDYHMAIKFVKVRNKVKTVVELLRWKMKASANSSLW